MKRNCNDTNIIIMGAVAVAAFIAGVVLCIKHNKKGHCCKECLCEPEPEDEDEEDIFEDDEE